jgi:hypothetical protein
MLGKCWEMSKQNVGEEGHHEDTKGECVCLATLKNIRGHQIMLGKTSRDFVFGFWAIWDTKKLSRGQ